MLTINIIYCFFIEDLPKNIQVLIMSFYNYSDIYEKASGAIQKKISKRGRRRVFIKENDTVPCRVGTKAELWHSANLSNSDNKKTEGKINERI